MSEVTLDMELLNDSGLSMDVIPGGGGGGTSDHTQLSNRDAADQHPISAITGLAEEIAKIPTAQEKAAWDGKQDSITDLNSIRSGAASGATAVQPSALNSYQTKAITDAGGYFTSDTVEGALQELGAELADIPTKDTVTSTTESSIVLVNHDTKIVTNTPSALTVTMEAPVSGVDYVTGFIFNAGSGFQLADTAPTGYALKWESEPTWTAGKVYEVIYRCLWIDNIISAKWAEVSV